jgi:hypothetical protein
MKYLKVSTVVLLLLLTVVVFAGAASAVTGQAQTTTTTAPIPNASTFTNLPATLQQDTTNTVIPVAAEILVILLIAAAVWAIFAGYSMFWKVILGTLLLGAIAGGLVTMIFNFGRSVLH